MHLDWRERRFATLWKHPLYFGGETKMEFPNKNKAGDATPVTGEHSLFLQCALQSAQPSGSGFPWKASPTKRLLCGSTSKAGSFVSNAPRQAGEMAALQFCCQTR